MTQTEDRIKIIYLHGFGSTYDPNSNKVKALSKIGDVSGFDIDYTAPPETIIKTTYDQVFKLGFEPFEDIFVGTSMGGWLASHIGKMCCMPFVALNPAIKPSETLQKYAGKGVDHVGRQYFMDKNIISKFPDIKMELDTPGLIMVNMDDDVIDPHKTVKMLTNRYRVEQYETGGHRFEIGDEPLDEIRKLINNLIAWGC
jgi:uncharacterized protein